MLLSKLCGCYLGRQDSWVGIVTTQVWWFWFQFLAGARYFYLLQNDETGFQAHPASYSLGIRSYVLGVKWPGHAVDHSHSSRAVIKNEWSYTFTFLIYLHGPYRDKFVFFYLLYVLLSLPLNCLSSLSPAWPNSSNFMWWSNSQFLTLSGTDWQWLHSGMDNTAERNFRWYETSSWKSCKVQNWSWSLTTKWWWQKQVEWSSD